MLTFAKADGDELRRIAAKLEPAMRREFIAAFDQLRRTVPINRITELVEQGKMGELATLIEGLTLGSTTGIESVLVAAAERMSKVTAAEFDLSFTIRNPDVEKWATEHATALIREMDEVTRRTVTDIVTTGFREGVAPRQQARLIKDVIGLTEKQSASVGRLVEGMKEAGFSQAKIDAAQQKMTKRLIKNRATVIARTETINASNQGQLQTWMDAIDSGLMDSTVERIWIASPDDRTCPICAVLDGKTVGFRSVGGDGFTIVGKVIPNPFESSVQAVGLKPGQRYVEGVTPTKPLKKPIQTTAPTAHPQCRCTTGLVFSD